MKNKNTKELIIMSVLTIVISAGVTTAFAHRAQGPNVDPAQRGALDEAVESGDYQAWLSLHPEDSPILDVVNEDNFDRLQAMHEAMQSGDRETADSIREELGFPNRGERGNRKGFVHEQADHQAIQEAVESGDYQAWLSLHPEDSPILDVVNEDNFDRLQAMHEAMQSGDRETADSIRAELGFPGRGERKQGFGRGMHKNLNTNN